MPTGLRTRLLPAALLVTLACGLGGCNEFSRNTDWHFGESFHKVFANQQLNPDAGTEGTPVVGYDGQKAANTVGRYQNKPAPVKGSGKESSDASGMTDAVLFAPKDSGKAAN